MKKKLNEVPLHKPTVEERLKKLEEYIYPEMGNVYGELLALNILLTTTISLKK